MPHEIFSGISISDRLRSLSSSKEGKDKQNGAGVPDTGQVVLPEKASGGEERASDVLGDIKGLLLAQAERDKQNIEINKQTLALLEQNFGKLVDKEIWLPFSVTIADGNARTVAIVVSEDIVFHYQGFGSSHVEGTSYREIKDGARSDEFFAPPASESATADQYGTKGVRIQNEVVVVIANATGAEERYDGYFRGRYRKGRESQ